MTALLGEQRGKTVYFIFTCVARLHHLRCVGVGVGVGVSVGVGVGACACVCARACACAECVVLPSWFVNQLP
jgi:hypothetical protein